ncbi:MAG: DUF4221 family protein [Algoriphagus sp.]
MNSIELMPSEEILSFPIDDSTSNVSMGLVYYDGQLINVNWTTNSLQFYNLKTQTKDKEIFFEEEGPNGVGGIFGIYPHNLDSIFLFNQVASVITLTDTSGNIKNRIQYEAPRRYSNAFVHNAYALSPPLLIKGKLLVKTHITGNYRAMTEEDLSKSDMAYSINLNSGSVKMEDLEYPEKYLSEGLKLFEPSIVFHPEYTVYSIFGDHRIFKKSKSGELETFEGKSQYLDEYLPKFPIDGARLETQRYLLGSSRYESLVYDDYRKVYYRIAYPTLQITQEEELIKLRQSSGPFVIQVFDESLNLITERYFEDEIYLPNNLFVAEKGLYISINNPFNPTAEEDSFRFRLLELVN